MVSISPVSFQGRLAQTKEGNLYEKCNTGKRIGTGIGLIGGTALALHPIAKLGAFSVGARFGMRGVMLSPLILAAGVGLTTLVGRAIGCIPDAIVNSSRKKAANEKAAEQAQPKIEPTKTEEPKLDKKV